MFKFFKAHRIIAIALVVVAVLGIVGGGVLAASSWQPSSLSTTVGTINIVAPPSEADFAYSLSSNQLNFGTTSFQTGVNINITSDYITITNTGNQPLHDITVEMVTPPTGLTNPVVSISRVYGDPTNGFQFAVILKADAVSSPTTIDLSTMVCTVTPY